MKTTGLGQIQAKHLPFWRCSRLSLNQPTEDRIPHHALVMARACLVAVKVLPNVSNLFYLVVLVMPSFFDNADSQLLFRLTIFSLLFNLLSSPPPLSSFSNNPPSPSSTILPPPPYLVFLGISNGKLSWPNPERGTACLDSQKTQSYEERYLKSRLTKCCLLPPLIDAESTWWVPCTGCYNCAKFCVSGKEILRNACSRPTKPSTPWRKCDGCELCSCAAAPRAGRGLMEVFQKPLPSYEEEEMEKVKAFLREKALQDEVVFEHKKLLKKKRERTYGYVLPGECTCGNSEADPPSPSQTATTIVDNKLPSFVLSPVCVPLVAVESDERTTFFLISFFLTFLMFICGQFGFSCKKMRKSVQTSLLSGYLSRTFFVFNNRGSIPLYKRVLISFLNSLLGVFGLFLKKKKRLHSRQWKVKQHLKKRINRKIRREREKMSQKTTAEGVAEPVVSTSNVTSSANHAKVGIMVQVIPSTFVHNRTCPAAQQDRGECANKALLHAGKVLGIPMTVALPPGSSIIKIAQALADSMSSTNAVPYTLTALIAGEFFSIPMLSKGPVEMSPAKTVRPVNLLFVLEINQNLTGHVVYSGMFQRLCYGVNPEQELPLFIQNMPLFSGRGGSGGGGRGRGKKRNVSQADLAEGETAENGTGLDSDNEQSNAAASPAPPSAEEGAVPVVDPEAEEEDDIDDPVDKSFWDAFRPQITTFSRMLIDEMLKNPPVLSNPLLKHPGFSENCTECKSLISDSTGVTSKDGAAIGGVSTLNANGPNKRNGWRSAVMIATEAMENLSNPALDPTPTTSQLAVSRIAARACMDSNPAEYYEQLLTRLASLTRTNYPKPKQIAGAPKKDEQVYGSLTKIASFLQEFAVQPAYNLFAARTHAVVPPFLRTFEQLRHLARDRNDSSPVPSKTILVMLNQMGEPASLAVTNPALFTEALRGVLNESHLVISSSCYPFSGYLRASVIAANEADARIQEQSRARNTNIAQAAQVPFSTSIRIMLMESIHLPRITRMLLRYIHPTFLVFPQV